jgi:beta-phosphoglucomutase-like phosphatase (HAD superfamily)
VTDMRIAVDLDGVVVNLCHAVYRLAAERHGVVIPWAPGESPAFYARDWGLAHSAEDVARINGLYYDHEALETAPPIDGAIEGVQRLDALAQVVFLTSRHERSLAVTAAWLDRHGLRQPLFIHVKDKGELALRLGCAIGVDDAPHHLAAYAHAGITPIRYAHRYNADGVGLPARNWSDVIALAEETLGVRAQEILRG